MNKNSEKIAIGSFLALFIVLLITAIIMTIEHFEWIETNLMGGNMNETVGISILTDDSDSINIMYNSTMFGAPTGGSGTKGIETKSGGISILTDDGDGTNIEVLIIDKKAEVFGITYNDSNGMLVTLTMPKDKGIPYEEMLKIWEKMEENIRATLINLEE